MLRKFLISLAAVLCLTMPAYAGAVKRDCGGALCDAFHHPRPRALKPIACTPIWFDQWQKDNVVATITYADGTAWTDPKPVDTLIGKFCYGTFRFTRHGGAVSVELCNSNGSAVLSQQQIETRLALGGRKGWYVTLKGPEWQQTHSPPRWFLRGAAEPHP